MVNILVYCLRLILGLRYQIQIKGLDSINKKDTRGILFIPNHPALIDPLIVFSALYSRFKLRPLIDENQVNGFILRNFMTKIRYLTIPDMTLPGKNSKQGVIQVMAEVVQGLHGGDQFLFYPSGRVYRSQYESLRGNSGVSQILKKVPNVRVVLVRTSGLWGSCYSRASGHKPSLYKDIGLKMLAILSGGIFFTPKREVTIELSEVDHLPDPEDRLGLNRSLEHFYNTNAPANSYVPYFWWQGVRPQKRPEPIAKDNWSDVTNISSELQSQVFAKITDLSGNNKFGVTDLLGSDVGMDSLEIADLGMWIGQEFGHVVEDMEALDRVSDVLLAASGQLVSTKK